MAALPELYLCHNDIMKAALVMESFTYESISDYGPLLNELHDKKPFFDSDGRRKEQLSTWRIPLRELHKQTKDKLWKQYDLYSRERLEVTSRDQAILQVFDWIQTRLSTAFYRQFIFASMESRWYFQQCAGDVDKSILGFLCDEAK